jgi:aminopeptidase
VNILAPGNTREGADQPAERLALDDGGRHRALAILLEREAAGEAVWCAAQYPTEAVAQEAGLSLAEYVALLERALLLDRSDAVAAWREVAERQERICRFLAGVDRLRIVAPGTDLELRVGGRRWMSAHGSSNLPDGEVFTGPHEDSAEGTITFTVPVLHGGAEVRDIRLRFERGRCVEAAAAAGEAVLLAALDLDEGARRLGEVAIGLNDGVDRATYNTLLDEKIGGTVHLALGASYVETGGVNQSDLHWDLVCDLRRDGEIHADGRLVYRDGRFLAETGLV